MNETKKVTKKTARKFDPFTLVTSSIFAVCAVIIMVMCIVSVFNGYTGHLLTAFASLLMLFVSLRDISKEIKIKKKLEERAHGAA
ncbi:hypothetical protein [Tannerella forsythia]|uniref:hypothetical protein n=1 Tax=Tannerella forsythia TaxID=28112 RepID=UPI0028F11BEB|nr:hypothetical protein [Tannerella forsythia]